MTDIEAPVSSSKGMSILFILTVTTIGFPPPIVVNSVYPSEASCPEGGSSGVELESRLTKCECYRLCDFININSYDII